VDHKWSKNLRTLDAQYALSLPKWVIPEVKSPTEIVPYERESLSRISRLRLNARCESIVEMEDTKGFRCGFCHDSEIFNRN
jgi:hypothetical protein